MYKKGDLVQILDVRPSSYENEMYLKCINKSGILLKDDGDGASFRYEVFVQGIGIRYFRELEIRLLQKNEELSDE